MQLLHSKQKYEDEYEKFDLPTSHERRKKIKGKGKLK